SSRRRHTRSYGDWSSDVCSSDLISEPIYPTMTAAPVEEIEAVPPTEDVEAPEELAAPPPLIPATPEPVSGSWREVHVDSHREPEPAVRDYEPEAGPPGEPMPAPTGDNVVFEQDPALRFDEEIAPATLPRKPDTAMRLAVGLGAAACVLLAAVLYEGGWLAKGLHNLNSTAPTATATLHPSASASARLSAPPCSCT